MLGKISVVVGVLGILVAVLTIHSVQDAIAEGVFFAIFRKFTLGKLCLVYPDGSTFVNGRLEQSPQCNATMLIRDKRAFSRMVFGGFSLGFGEAYVDDLWDVPEREDLFQVLLLLGENVVQHPSKWVLRLEAWKPNVLYNEYLNRYMDVSVAGDRAKVGFHYDIGNDFFEHILDDTLIYSCAVWSEKAKTLRKAQQNKVEIIAAKTDIRQDNKLLDIGSGWGWAAYYVAKKYKDLNVSVDAISISKNQIQYSNDKYLGKNLPLRYLNMHYEKLADPEFKEYYDNIYSIGFLEHVQFKQLDAYFQTVIHALKPDGRIVQHFITVNDNYSKFKLLRRERACVDVSFVYKYIFPGVCIQPTDWVHEAARRNGLTVIHKEFFGMHYMRTLAVWRTKLVENWDVLKKKPKYDETLMRQYNFYFAFCELGFRMQRYDLVQFVFLKLGKAVNRLEKFDYTKVVSPYVMT